MAIYVDGDACPVKQEVLKVAERHGLRIVLVANQWQVLAREELVEMILVAAEADAADDWIAEQAGPGDIVVTADIPLADRCLKAGARVLNHTGKAFTAENIGGALAMRGLLADLRDGGQISGGGPSFSRQDRARFLVSLENTVQAVKKAARG